MKTALCKRSAILSILIIALMLTGIVSLTSCEDFGLTSSGETEETNEPDSGGETHPTIVNTEDAALLAVYRHLLDRAESHDAKSYLSDFYTACDNWDAESEYFKDGSDVWHVFVDMTGESSWDLAPYWRQASWFILPDGEVIPSNLFEANALRIEADLQALSPVPAADSE